MSERSTIRAGEMWDASVGRWVPLPTPATVASIVTPSATPSMVVETRRDGFVAKRSAAYGQRMYAAARNSRTTQGFGTSGPGTSADAELHTSLPMLRSRARQMIRDASYAKRAKKILVDNVIGAGVGFQAQVMTNRGGTLNEKVNADIEEAFSEWCMPSSCHTGGKLHLGDLERMAFGNIFEAGEVLIRMHYRPFGDSQIPLCLEVIEPERLAHDIVPPGVVTAGADIRMGVEVDQFHRPLAYWIRSVHPGDIRHPASVLDRFERVPASDIFHLYVVDRWPQTRGEPWLHTTLRKLDELNEYTGLEVSAARGSAAYFATIETPEDESSVATDEEDDGTPVMNLEPLTIQELAPGEKLEFHAPNRPNAALDPFMRAMLREIAAGAHASYESLSRDYSQSNYSSSRMGLLEDRDLYRILQQWWIRNFRMPLHRKWLQMAALSGSVPSLPVQTYAASMRKYEAARWKPRGWTWIDPTAEVDAFKEAIKGGLTTVTDVIAQTANGQDLEDYIKTRVRELDMLKAAGLIIDTTVVPGAPPAAPKPTTAPAPEGRVVPIARTA